MRTSHEVDDRMKEFFRRVNNNDPREVGVRMCEGTQEKEVKSLLLRASGLTDSIQAPGAGALLYLFFSSCVLLRTRRVNSSTVCTHYLWFVCVDNVFQVYCVHRKICISVQCTVSILRYACA